MDGILPWAAVGVALLGFLWVDLRFFARGREPGYREGVVWSLAWLGVALLAAAVLFLSLIHI